MRLRYVTALVGVAALGIISGPSTAHGAEFTYSGPVIGHGSVTMTSGAFRIGACTTEAAGEVGGFNGEIFAAGMAVPCATNVSNCDVGNVEVSVPMELDLTGLDGISITSVTIKYTFTGAGCAGAGVPTGVGIPYSGTLTGTTTSGGCLHFNSAGDLKNELNLAAATVDGTLCLTDIFANPITID